MTPAIEIALLYLSRFSRTKKQLETYLHRKGFSGGEIAEATEYLLSHNFLNDESFAESFVLSKIRHLDGPFKIQKLLFQKGIDPQIADRLLKKLYPVELQTENAKKLLERRSKKSRESNIRFIASRGFNRYVILRLLSR